MKRQTELMRQVDRWVEQGLQDLAREDAEMRRHIAEHGPYPAPTDGIREDQDGDDHLRD